MERRFLCHVQSLRPASTVFQVSNEHHTRYRNHSRSSGVWDRPNTGASRRERYSKSEFIKNFLTVSFSCGNADLVEDENGQPIWKATKKLVRELGPELGQLQPSPAPDLPMDIGFYDKH
jgi:hypothetical protein